MADNQPRYDVDSYQVVTDALMELLKQFPLLGDDEIRFSMLNEDEGIGMFPMSSAIIESEQRDIRGYVTQVCNYPFYVIYRALGLTEERKQAVIEWLDTLGQWLEKQPIIADSQTVRLEEYPPLSGDREFTEIKRTSTASLGDVYTNNAEDWTISISAQYRNRYKRKDLSEYGF